MSSNSPDYNIIGLIGFIFFISILSCILSKIYYIIKKYCSNGNGDQQQLINNDNDQIDNSETPPPKYEDIENNNINTPNFETLIHR